MHPMFPSLLSSTNVCFCLIRPQGLSHIRPQGLSPSTSMVRPTRSTALFQVSHAGGLKGAWAVCNARERCEARDSATAGRGAIAGRGASAGCKHLSVQLETSNLLCEACARRGHL